MHCPSRERASLLRERRPKAGCVAGEASPWNKYIFFSCSSSVVHVPGVNDIQSSSSTSQNMSQISRQLNQSQVAWTGSRPPFPGQVWASGGHCPQVPRGCRAPGMCLLGIPALRMGQHSGARANPRTPPDHTARLPGGPATLMAL